MYDCNPQVILENRPSTIIHRMSAGRPNASPAAVAQRRDAANRYPALFSVLAYLAENRAKTANLQK
jgi:hypothetical protein